MAVTAVAIIGSSLSPSFHSRISSHSKHSSDLSLLNIISTRTSISHSHPIHQFLISCHSQPWRLPNISGAVGQATEDVVTVDQDEEEAKTEGTLAVDPVEEEAIDTVVKEEKEEDGGETKVEVRSRSKLYFGNLPYHCDSAQLAGIVQQYGNPEMVEVLYDRSTGKSRGFGFVTMSNFEDANLVQQNLDGIEHGGRILRVNFSDKPRPKEPLYLETEFKLFVGNLSWTATSESLIKAFQEYGNVVGARVLYDGETGRSRGYGFVSYSTKSEMDTALQSLNGVELEGRAMRVSMAEGKKA